MSDYVSQFEYLKEPAKIATQAYQNGTRYFDQMKEILLIEHGLKHTAELFHHTAHWFPSQFDVIGDILHQRHVMQVYGETREFPGIADDTGACFRFAIEVFAEIETALKTLIRVSDENGSWALARQFENLQVQNSTMQERFMYAWKMYEETDSASSFDNWVRTMMEETDGDE